MNEVETGPEEIRGGERRRAVKTPVNSNSGEPADSVALTRSQIGVPPPVADAANRDRKRERGESSGRSRPFAEKLQMQKAVRDANEAAASLRTQVSAVKVQLKTAQEALEHQKDTGMQEAARMAVRVSLLEEELAVVSMQAVRDRGQLSRERNQWRAWASLAMTVCVLGMVGWWMMPTAPAANLLAAQGRSAAAQRDSSQVDPNDPTLLGADQNAKQQSGRKDNQLPDDPPAALNMGLDRLNSAVADLPGQNFDEALRRISVNGDDCAMVWSNDKPSVLFPGNRAAELKEPVRRNALANTLADCADAVSRLY
ncbi:MAG TPA: hypothetical protein VGL82_04885 [Bryobacteraceae bacterium]